MSGLRAVLWHWGAGKLQRIDVYERKVVVAGSLPMEVGRKLRQMPTQLGR